MKTSWKSKSKLHFASSLSGMLLTGFPWITAVLILCTAMSSTQSEGMTITQEIEPERYPDVAYTSTAYAGTPGVYLVVWEQEDSPTNTNIYGRLVSDLGVYIGSIFPIASEVIQERHPVVASDGYNDYLVVFERQSSGNNFDIYGQRVSSSGIPVGAPIIISNDAKNETNPAVVWDSCWPEFVIVWEHHHSSSDIDIHGRIVGSSDTLPDWTPYDSFVVAESIKNEMNPDIGDNLNGPELIVVWEYQINPTDTDIKGRSLEINWKLEPTLGSTFSIAVSKDPELSPAIAGSYLHEFLIVWHRSEKPDWDSIRGRIINDPTNPYPEFPIAGFDAMQEPEPDVMAFGTGGWRVVWPQTMWGGPVRDWIMGLDILPDEVDNKFTISVHDKTKSRPAVPSIATVSSSLTVWELRYDSIDYDIHGAIP